MHARLIAALCILVASAAARGDDLFDDRPVRPLAIGSIDWLSRLDQPTETQPPTAPPTPPSPTTRVAPASDPPKAYGDKGSQWMVLGGGIASDFHDSTDYNLLLAWNYFIIRNVELSVELNGWFMDQKGDNAFGINPAFVFRWHFFNEGRWTVYTDAGIGLLLTSEDTPTGGTGFNFTPRFGGGATYRLDDAGTRLQVGVRWHHISNARIHGDSENPSRDGVMAYMGVMIPF